MVIVVDASPRLARIGRTEDPDHVVNVAGDEEGGIGCVGSGSAEADSIGTNHIADFGEGHARVGRVI